MPKLSKYALPLALLFALFSAAAGLAAPASGIKRLGYAIQMGAFADVKNAERFTKRLQEKGIEAFYFRKDNGIYAVRFGDFPSHEKARAAAAKLVSDRLIGSYYIAPPNEVVFGAAKAPGLRQQTDEITKPRPPQSDTRPAPRNGRVVEEPAEKPVKQGRGDRDMGSIAARTAERFVGIPYRWGGDTVVDGMDCSGFVRAVYNLCGVSIPRTSREQYRTGDSVGRDGLQDGDLVFFGASEDSINHVGIYVGNGRFVHAPRRGEDIRITTIEESYFVKRFMGGRRYFQ